MTLEETRKRILEDDAFVTSETQKLRYLYGLKKEIRYAQNRDNIIDTESVAEHIYGMHILAHYFLPLEDTENKLDKPKVFQMITWHDMEEIETGDTISHIKTEKHLKAAEEAIPLVISKMPELIQADVEQIITEYEAYNSSEAKFVKAIDKVEPLFEVQGEDYKKIMHANKNTIDNHWDTKYKYIKDYPYIMRFAEIGTQKLEREGYFVPST